jgi:molybdopterin/thiamine biosynthesis adenylyltransferase
MVDGEPFETPQCPPELLDTQFTVVHDDGNDAWPAWSGHIGCYGKIRWGILSGFDKTIVAEEFFDTRGDQIRSCRRGSQPSEKSRVGYWWLWPAPIVTPPWLAPGTWAELRQIAIRLDVEVDPFILWMTRHAGGKEPAVILLGYPIPTFWNGAPAEVHWQAIRAPKIPTNIKPMNGFRPNQRGRIDRLRRDIFKGKKRLSYLKTENWHPDRIQARGRLLSSVRDSSVAVIGAGALGAAVAELLTRGGVAEILIIDHDNLEIGNLVRHTLTGSDLGCNKATATTARLQGVAPMSRITSHAGRLPSGDALQTLLEPFDVVLDCTGEDDVLRHLGSAWWSLPRHFLSASLGFAAIRLFLFEAQACCFPFEEFVGAVQPWLAKERSLWTAMGETLEGAGCWSPLFPARSDDVWLAAVTTVKYLERSIKGSVCEGLRVLEQPSDEALVGYHPVQLEDAK